MKLSSHTCVELYDNKPVVVVEAVVVTYMSDVFVPALAGKEQRSLVAAVLLVDVGAAFQQV